MGDRFYQVPLMFPPFHYTIKRKLNKTYILDPIRKKYLLLTSEEWVRQHVLNYLINDLAYPKGLFRLEQKINGSISPYRPDIVFCDQFGAAKMVIECKAPYITVTDAVLQQVIQYNRQLLARYLLITNGLQHFCWEWTTDHFEAIQYIPSHQMLLKDPLHL